MASAEFMLAMLTLLRRWNKHTYVSDTGYMLTLRWYTPVEATLAMDRRPETDTRSTYREKTSFPSQSPVDAPGDGHRGEMSPEGDAAQILVRGLAHCFNNLFQALMSRAELLRIQAAADESLTAIASALVEDVERGAEVVRRLMLVANLGPRNRRRLDLNEVAAAAVAHCERHPRQGPRVVLEPDPVPCWIAGDRAQLEEVIADLVVNARDYSPPSGQVRVRTTSSQREVYLDVIDSGAGVPEEHVGRIFEPFLTTRRALGHDGLGLAVVRTVILAHGGRIALATSRGQGSRFRVVLPAWLPDRPPP